MKTEPSKTQIELVKYMAENQSPLVRLHGGYWMATNKAPVSGRIDFLNDVWFGTRTIEASEKLGLIENKSGMLGRWKARFVLTDKGKQYATKH